MNKHIPRERKFMARLDRDYEYRFLLSPLARKAEEGTITKRRMGTSPGRHGVKAPYPPIVRNVLYRARSTNKYA